MPLIKVKNKSKYVYALVDDKDFNNLNRHKWYLSKAGYVCHSHYERGKRILWYIHKQILQPRVGYYTDHINLNKLDNRTSNLRECTVSQNNTHRQLKNKTGYRGVAWNKRDKRWQVYLKKEGKSIYGGQFYSLVDAAKKYNDLAYKIHGDFAMLNKFAKDLD